MKRKAPPLLGCSMNWLQPIPHHVIVYYLSKSKPLILVYIPLDILFHCLWSCWFFTPSSLILVRSWPHHSTQTTFLKILDIFHIDKSCNPFSVLNIVAFSTADHSAHLKTLSSFTLIIPYWLGFSLASVAAYFFSRIKTEAWTHGTD